MSFEAQVARISTDIKSRINALIDRLKDREKSLLKELKEILDKHQQEKEKESQCVSELNKVINFAQETITSEILRVCHDSMVETARKRLKEIESELSSKQISFDSDTTLLDRISHFGKITVSPVDSCLPVVDYKEKVSPVVSIGSNGSSEGQFDLPFGVVSDYRTNNIYVAEERNHRVQVFDEDGKYLFKFGDMNGPGKMNCPLCIAIYKEKVFVTQVQAGCVLVYGLNGNFIIQIGNQGSGERQFNRPRGITIDRNNGDIYVCDTGNKRIQIFSENYSLKSQFGKETLQSPTDVQLTRDIIYVLSNTKPFLITFNYNLSPIQNTVCNSISNYLKCPYCLMLDGAGNIIISDYGSNTVFIFNQQGEILHSLKEGIYQPMGVSIDYKGRIIVVGYNYRLLLF